jgi:DNA primase catalytic core
MSSIVKLGKLDARTRDFVYGASRVSLCQDSTGKPGLEYLLYKRNIDIETIAAFRLGFVPFINPGSYISKTDGKPEDLPWVRLQMAGRIVFPIFDVHDRLIALSLRPIRDEDATEQKYWNEAFPKGEHLFGLNLAKYYIAKWDFAIIVEGQVDVLKSHSLGLQNTVGIMGGAFTPLHAQLLKGWTRNFVFLFDNDEGGRKHADKARDVLGIYKQTNRGATSSRIKYAFANLPPGYDPDSFLGERGGKELRELIAESMKTNSIYVPSKWA